MAESFAEDSLLPFMPHFFFLTDTHLVPDIMLRDRDDQTGLKP